MSKINKVSRISLIGGLIGAIATNPRKALQKEIDEHNHDGWSTVQITNHSTTNTFIWLLQILVLILTLGLFTWGGGYLVLFEKDKEQA